ncbi:MAG TPA: EVE domain-containing protein [Thermomicrobiaceae bacterium]|nr:EVE domain-containing protein [Thermomicrobiaceae bacterium]
MAEPGYWIIVGSPENLATTRRLGFTVQGMKSRHRKKAEQMRPGDKLVYYVTGRKAFGAIATVTSEYFEDHEIIWRSTDPKKAAEDYPFRVQIEPDILLPDGDYLPAEGVARGMEYVRKWPAQNWTLAFQGNVHRINRHDYELIRTALVDQAAAAAAD